MKATSAVEAENDERKQETEKTHTQTRKRQAETTLSAKRKRKPSEDDQLRKTSGAKQNGKEATDKRAKKSDK